MHFVYLFLIFCATEVFCEDDTIQEILPNVAELDAFAAKHKMAIVFFYNTPENCADCAAALKHFQDAANKYATETPELVFAKLDGSKISSELHSHEILYFPNFRFYKNGQGFGFEGETGAKQLNKFITEKSDPDFPPPNHVLILGKNNFTQTVNKEPLMLVEFFAPWCGHCKSLAPEYTKAAHDLSQLENPIPLATVDATVETELAKEYGVTGYPTLKVFRRGAPSDYKGPRERAGIVDFMKRASEPATKTISSLRDLETYQKALTPIILGLFTSQDDPRVHLFVQASENFRDKIESVKTFSQDVIDKYGGKTGRILIVQPEFFQSKHEKPFVSHDLDADKDTVDSVTQFIRSNLFPYVGVYSRFFSQFYDEIQDDKPLCLVFMQVDFTKEHVKQTQKWKNKVLEAINAYKDKVRFALAHEADWGSLLKDFGLEDAGEDMSIGCFHQAAGSSKKKYVMEAMDEFDSDHIQEFVKQLLQGKLKPHLRSAIAPVRYEGSFRPVVGANIESIVFDGKSHTVVYFYTHECTSCRSIYRSLEAMAAKLLAQDESKKLRFVKLETSQNDYPSPPFQLQGPPDFYLVKEGSRANVTPYTGDNFNVEALKTFIETHVPLAAAKKEEL